MADGRDDQTLSIGDAVRFSHRGRTIHGHLLRRQGRRRLATVIDAGEGLWKVSEAALSPSGRARRATMLTPQDAARARWRVGDRVTFASTDGALQGKIVKLNPTQARVRAGRSSLERALRGPQRRGHRQRALEERCGAPEPHRRDGPRADGRARSRYLDLRLPRSRASPRRLPLSGPCNPRRPRPRARRRAKPRSGTRSCTKSPMRWPARKPATALGGKRSPAASAPPREQASTNAGGR